jgi:DNA-binding MarR family transcriptional regulator
MHGWILRYLYSRRGQPVYQRDIERDFAITRSTVTNILQLMERKGYIRRESVPEDARLKRLELTDAGAEAHEKMLLALFQTDEFISGLLTEQENAELLRLLGKLYEGLR